jgi:hypothetical protein
LGNASEATWAQVCSPCVGKYLELISSLDPNATHIAKVFQMYCIRDGAKFCFREFILFNQNNQNLTLFCAPCIKKVLVAYLQSGVLATQDRPGVIAALASAKKNCVLNENGQYCHDVALPTLELIGSTCSQQFDDLSCNQTCKELITRFVSLGCCATVYAKIGAEEEGTDFDTFVNGIRALCQVSGEFAPVCKNRTANFQARLGNLKYTYYVANKASVDQKVIGDVAAAAGVDSSAVSVISFSPLGGASSISKSRYQLSSFQMLAVGTSITTSISSNTDDVTNIQAQLQQAQSSGNLPFPAVSTLPPDASVDPLAGAGAPTSTTTSGASTGASLPSVAVLVTTLALTILVF